MVAPNGDLDVRGISSPFWTEQLGENKRCFFVGLSTQPTNHPPPNKTLYIYIYTLYSPILYYLYSISILPLYTLVGWTDSINKLKSNELDRPPTQKLRWPLVGQIATRWTNCPRNCPPKDNPPPLVGQDFAVAESAQKWPKKRPFREPEPFGKVFASLVRSWADYRPECSRNDQGKQKTKKPGSFLRL